MIPFNVRTPSRILDVPPGRLYRRRQPDGFPSRSDVSVTRRLRLVEPYQ